MPYLDMCVLLSGDIDAVRRDGELLRRLEKWYPQVVWYVRARMRLQQGAVGFDEISDNAVAELRQSRLDPRVERELSTLHSAYDTEMERVSQAESDSHSDQRRPHCTASHTRRKSGAASGSTARPGTQRIASDGEPGLDAQGDTVSGSRPGTQRIASDVMQDLTRMAIRLAQRGQAHNARKATVSRAPAHKMQQSTVCHNQARQRLAARSNPARSTQAAQMPVTARRGVTACSRVERAERA